MCSKFKPFKKPGKLPKANSFVVIRYTLGYISSPKFIYKLYYLDSRTNHSKYRDSYFATSVNYRDGITCHDIGQYIWTDEPMSWKKTEWRYATTYERRWLKARLFMFNKPPSFSIRSQPLPSTLEG